MAGETTEGMVFCRDCGSEIKENAEICPECGVRQATSSDDDERAERAKQFLIAGAALGFLAILILPIVLAPLAALCGILAMVYGRPMAGAGIVAWAVIAFIIGVILGLVGLFAL